MKRLFAILMVLILAGLATAQQEVTAGSTDEIVYFVAVDDTDLHTRETDLVAGDFTVYYSINGGAATAMTTPTVTEISKANMPGEYKLLVDEAAMTTLGATKNQANMLLSISHANMDRVSLSVIVRRPIITGGETLTVASGVADADMKKIIGTAPTEGAGGRLAASFTKQYDVATPVFTAASVNQTGDAYVPALAAQTAAEAMRLQRGTVATAGTASGFTLSSGFPAVAGAYPRGTILTVVRDGQTYLSFIQTYTAGRAVKLVPPLPAAPELGDVVTIWPSIWTPPRF